MAYITLENLSFAYPAANTKALDGICLSLQQGEYITLCGKSGSGKTTLMRHLKPVLTPVGKTSGSVLLRGVPIKDMPLREQSAKIGYVMQNPDSQIVTDKVWHELAFGLESLGCEQSVMRLRVAEMASYFGIQDWFGKNVAELSGGQKQLLNLASIMAMQPEILILDEPTSQLDPIAAADFLATVRKINLELGTTVILSEHRLEEVFPVADRVIMMEGGRIAACGSPREIGETLRKSGNDMFVSLPSPMRIYYETNSALPCPLTVREGRGWLSESFCDAAPQYTEMPEEKPILQNSKTALELKELWFRYDKNAKDVLKGTSLSVPQGQLFAVVGGNGTGKSTMLKSICGVCRPYMGKVMLFGKKLESYPQNALFSGCLAMLPQDPQSLFVKKTVAEDLAEMLDGAKYSPAEKERLLSEAVRDCALESLLAAHPYDLSGGEQQRAALAKVLLCEPRLLLLDEPTKGLDNYFKNKLAEILKRLTAKGVSILMVSHDVEFCAAHADSVAMFFDGGIVTVNTAKRFFAQNSFYTTAANRMSRHVFQNAVTNEEVAALWNRNMQ